MASRQKRPLRTEDREHIFRFFDLAAELRNSVYDECMGGVSFTLEHLHVESEKDTITNLLLVSRQFKSEYEDRLRGRAKLTLTNARNSPCTVVDLPAGAKRILTVEIHTVGILAHEDWLRHLTWQPPRPTNLNVLVLCPSFINVDAVLDRLSVMEFNALPGLRQLDLFVREGTISGFDIANARRVITFDHQDQCFKKVEST